MGKYIAQFYVEKEIKASPKVVWDIISKPAGLMDYHPFMEKHTLTSSRWGHIGDQDLLNYYSGFVYERTIVVWLEGEGFDVYNTTHGKQPCTAQWRITPKGDDACVVRITGIANFLEAFPSFVAKLVLRYKMKPTLSDYLENLLKGLEYHATTGNQTRKNQFGGHKMFSPSDV